MKKSMSSPQPSLENSVSNPPTALKTLVQTPQFAPTAAGVFPKASGVFWGYRKAPCSNVVLIQQRLFEESADCRRVLTSVGKSGDPLRVGDIVCVAEQQYLTTSGAASDVPCIRQPDGCAGAIGVDGTKRQAVLPPLGDCFRSVRRSVVHEHELPSACVVLLCERGQLLSDGQCSVVAAENDRDQTLTVH